MTDTTFSIELQGLNLPYDVSSGLESELRSTVLAELAKVDLGKGMKVEPLPDGTERKLSGPIRGFVVRNIGAAERDVSPFEPSLLAPMPLLPDWLRPWLRPSTPPVGPMVPPVDFLEHIYHRPDVRAACAANSQALAELLSKDEQAMLVVNELIAGASGEEDAERLGPLAGAVVLAGIGLAAGVGIGYLVNRHK
jgi:hypothetical protein